MLLRIAVPSRGLCFQSRRRSDEELADDFVSVPSRGLCFQSFVVDMHNSPIKVSVPSRGLCFQSTHTNMYISLTACRFRPLSGIMFSISTVRTYKNKYSIVSVPSRGLCFQSKKEWGFNYGKTVSVPSRGLCFQSTLIDYSKGAIK